MFNSIKTLRLWQVLLVVVVMAAGGGASYLAYAQFIAKDNASDEDRQVIQVARGDLVQQVTTSGSLLYPNRYALGFPTQGTVGEVLVEEGQPGDDGAVVAQTVTVIPEDIGGLWGGGGFSQP